VRAVHRGIKHLIGPTLHGALDPDLYKYDRYPIFGSLDQHMNGQPPLWRITF
jgi:hypothetical protein